MKTIKLVLLTVLCSILLCACSRPPRCDDKVSTNLIKQRILDFYTARLGVARTSSFLFEVRDVEQLAKSDETGNYRCSATVHFTNLANNYTSSSPIRFETKLSEKDGKPDLAPFMFKFD